MDNVEKVKEESKDSLLNRPNVVGVGVGEKKQGDVSTGEQSILVFVEKKVPEGELSAGAMVPKEIDGVKTDVIEVGELRPMTVSTEETEERHDDSNAMSAAGAEHRKRYRPLCGGISCIQSKGTACTLASIVYRGGKRYGLQNAHCAWPHWEGIKKGQTIMQPSPYDGGDDRKDAIGKAFEVCELVFGGAPNRFDSALIEINDDIESKDCFQFGIGAHSPKIAGVKVGEELVKSGRTTGVQRAKVIAVNVTAQVTYDEGKVGVFENQIFTENEGARFVDGGDSSSLVLNAAGNPVGQVFAGSNKIAIISPIEPILKHFGIAFTKDEMPVGEGFLALTRKGAVRPYVELYPVNAKAGNRGDLDYNMQLRKAPSVNQPSIGVLKAGTKFEILEMVEGDGEYTWARVRVLN